MRLEDLRGWQLADAAVRQVNGSGTSVPCAFDHHAGQAAWHTINAIQRLAGESVDGRVDERIGVVEWWRTLETLVSLLHLISLEEHEAAVRQTDQRPTGSDRIIDKWRSVSRWFSDGRESPPSPLTGLLTELRDFRNSFEHSVRTAARERSHSRLASTPADANLADLMEAVAICVAAIQWIRYVLPSVDLMPRVWTPTVHDYVVFVPLDELANELWFPAFRNALQTRGLTSDVKLYADPGPLTGSAIQEYALLIRIDDERPLPPTTGDSEIHAQIAQWGTTERPQPPDGKWFLPDYTRA